MTEIQEKLFSYRDLKYRDFQSKLIPNVDINTVIGVRTPDARRLAKELYGTQLAEEFLNTLPHYYFDENNLHAFLIEREKDYNRAIEQTDRFLPFIDNWATCDQLRPKVYNKHTDELIDKIKEWISSERVYTCRYGIEMLMTFYLDGLFKPEYNDLAASAENEDYYVKMMVAWYFATALAKQYDKTLPYIENRVLSPWVHNKSIQKATESFRISPEQKIYLKKLKG